MDWRNTSKEAPTDFESKIYLLKISLYNQYLIFKTPYIIKYIKCCVFSEAGISINGLAKLSWCSPPPFPHTAWCLALVKWLLPAKLSSPAVGTYRLHPPLQEALMGRVHKPWWPCNWVTSNSKTSVPCVCVCVCVCHHWLSLLFSHSVVSDSLRHYGLQYTRLPCPSPSPGVSSHSCPLNQWCHPTISSSVVPLSSCPQIFPSIRVFSNVYLILFCPEK